MKVTVQEHFLPLEGILFSQKQQSHPIGLVKVKANSICSLRENDWMHRNVFLRFYNIKSNATTFVLSKTLNEYSQKIQSLNK